MPTTPPPIAQHPPMAAPSSQPTARRSIAQQAARALRRACADAVIFNDGLSMASLEDEVESLWRQWGVTGP